MKIKRDQYLDELVSRQHNGLIKVVTGLRRCGKTYLLFTLFKEHLLAEGVDEKHIVEIAFDAFENRQLRAPQVLFPRLKEQLQGSGMHYVLLDEVQLLGDFEAVLNSLIRMKNVDVYAAGSNASHLSKDVITEFRGRGDKVPVHPLSFAEFMSAYQGTKQDGWHEYLTYGGLPQILGCTTQEQKSAFLKSLFEEVYIPDIIERHNIRGKAALEEVVNLLSSAVGSPANPEKISAAFKATRKKAAGSTTIKRYIGCLCDSFLIDSAPRYDVKGKRSVGTSAKYYFTDMGLRNARLNFRQADEAPCPAWKTSSSMT